MNDLISRQAAIAHAVPLNLFGREVMMVSVSELENLPSAQPERKKGKWIHHPEWEDDGECGYECSECHMGSDVDYNFCMRCGADMRGEQDGNQGEGS